MKKFCTNCGTNVKEGAKFCLNCGVSLEGESTPASTTSIGQGKSKIVAGLLGIFLGTFGIHNFYLGYTEKGIAQLLLTILSCGVFSFISSIWGFVEGVLILAGEIKTDANGVDLHS